MKVKREIDRDTLVQVARTSLRTKVHQELADLLTNVSWLFEHTDQNMYVNLICRRNNINSLVEFVCLSLAEGWLVSVI